jgi:phage antirepressor YoqD-like protein
MQIVGIDAAVIKDFPSPTLSWAVKDLVLAYADWIGIEPFREVSKVLTPAAPEALDGPAAELPSNITSPELCQLADKDPYPITVQGTFVGTATTLPAGINIGDTHIRQDAEGRYCLNDLHKASGGEKKNYPSMWMVNKQTQALVEELESQTGIPGRLEAHVNTFRDKDGVQRTYVVKELVYAYAMWISPSFHLKVIRTFDQVVTGQMQPAAPMVPTNLKDALRLALESMEAKDQALLEAKEAREESAAKDAVITEKEEVILQKDAVLVQKEETIAEMEPKVETYEAVMSSEGLLLVRETAKLIGYAPESFRTWLKMYGFILKDNSASAGMVNKGYMMTKMSPYTTESGRCYTSCTPYFTPAGVEKIRKLALKAEELRKTAGKPCPLKRATVHEC